jgi:hypothetical protein
VPPPDVEHIVEEAEETSDEKGDDRGQVDSELEHPLQYAGSQGRLTGLTWWWGNSRTVIPSDDDLALASFANGRANANGMKRSRLRIYTDATTRPWDSGLGHTSVNLIRILQT